MRTLPLFLWACLDASALWGPKKSKDTKGLQSIVRRPNRACSPRKGNSPRCQEFGTGSHKGLNHFVRKPETMCFAHSSELSSRDSRGVEQGGTANPLLGQRKTPPPEPDLRPPLCRQRQKCSRASLRGRVNESMEGTRKYLCPFPLGKGTLFFYCLYFLGVRGNRTLFGGCGDSELVFHAIFFFRKPEVGPEVGPQGLRVRGEGTDKKWRTGGREAELSRFNWESRGTWEVRRSAKKDKSGWRVGGDFG